MPSKEIFRRKFLTGLALGGMLASIGLCVAGVLRFLLLNVFYERSSIFKIGKAKDYPLGVTIFLPDHNVYVSRDAEGIYVVSAICTHLGCVVSRKSEGFQCPCHGSVYDTEGRIVKGPAPTALKWFKIAESPDGQLMVDKRNPVVTGTKFKYV